VTVTVSNIISSKAGAKIPAGIFQSCIFSYPILKKYIAETSKMFSVELNTVGDRITAKSIVAQCHLASRRY